MKKFYLFALALGVLMLGSCSDNDDVVADNSSTTEVSSDTKGYMNVKINLPTTSSSSTRAANDKYDDGLPSEYAVKNATLILFSGATAANATIFNAYDLDLTWNTDLDGTDADNITSYANKVVEIDAVNSTDNYYALVVLNHNGLFSVADGKLTFDGASSAFAGSYVDFMKMGLSSENLVNGVSSLTKDGIFMTNTVFSKLSGATSDVAGAGNQTTTLVEIDKATQIFETEVEAETQAAIGNGIVSICVERAVAKVDVTQGTLKDFSISVDGATAANINYTIDAWALANTNTSTYLIRNWGEDPGSSTVYGDAWYALTSTGSTTDLTTNPYRFAGTVKANVDVAVDGGYRTYWGIDENYTGGNFKDAIFAAVGSSDVTNAIGTDNYVYCLENTFDVSNQNVMYTTCAIVKVTLGDRTTDYYIYGDDKTVLYTLTGAQNLYASKIFEKYTTDELKALFTGLDTSKSYKITVSKLTFADASAGKVTLSEAELTATAEDGSSLTADITTTLNTDEKITFNCYDNGAMYYTVLIKHFGDELTPWNDEEVTGGGPAPSVSEAYPETNGDSGNNNYLGRYGVLRNNWYSIEVTGIQEIGDATVPSVNTETEPDDHLECWMNYNINVLSWAKRTQSVLLQ